MDSRQFRLILYALCVGLIVMNGYEVTFVNGYTQGIIERMQNRGISFEISDKHTIQIKGVK